MGASISPTVILCVSVAVFPQASVYVQLRVMISGQLAPSVISVPLTVPLPSQLSVQFNDTIGGTFPTHTVTSTGDASNTGNSVSSTKTSTPNER